MSSRIEKIETWACSLPLPHPLDFGAFTVRSREYVAIRLATADGLVSDCLSLSRRSPIDVAVVDVLAPLLLGRDAMDISGRAADIAAGTRPMDSDGVIGRARSLIDICLWDLQAQARGVPLWKHLGGADRDIEVLLVEGYSLPDEDDEAFASRLAARVSEGFSRIKIEAASYRVPDILRHRLQRFRDIAGDRPEIVLDLAWCWPDAQAAMEPIAMWRDCRLAWIEDPMPRDRVAEIAKLRHACGVPIGVGDECTRAAEMYELIRAEAVDVLRLDATAIGGLGTVMEVGAKGFAEGRKISLHEHPEVHEHLAFTMPGCDHVELSP